MTQPTRAISHRDGVPIYQYRTDPDVPPVSVHPAPGHRGASRPGPAHPRLPGAVVRPRRRPGVRGGRGRGVGPTATGYPGSGCSSTRPRSARTHDRRGPRGAHTRCSSRFCTDTRAGCCGWRSPWSGRPVWDNTIRSIESELDRAAARDIGKRLFAHLTVLLIELARLARAHLTWSPICAAAASRCWPTCSR